MYSPSDDTEAPPPQPQASDETRGGDEGEEEEEAEAEAGSQSGETAVPEDDDAEGSGTAAANSNTATNNNNLSITASPNLDSLFGLREIGREALCWQLSSAKPGNGVEQIRDGSTETYWQSDGTTQPHWIQVHFARRVGVSHVCLYLDYNADESYTPKRVRVEAGMTCQDLLSAIHPANTQIEFDQPVGWCIIPLQSPPDPLDDYEDEDDDEASIASRKLVRAHLIRISILAMHQNGRDTHIRQVQLWGPRTMDNTSSGMLPALDVVDPALDHHGGDASQKDTPMAAPDNRHVLDDFGTMNMQFATIR